MEGLIVKSWMVAFVAAALWGSAALGVDVLVLSSGLAPIDNAVIAALTAGGHKATIGPQFFEFTGDVDLNTYEVVYFQANNNWASGPMPDSGRASLVEFIDAGGGMVTSEWATYVSTLGNLGELSTAIPGKYLGTAGAATTAYTVQTPDAVLNKGLADSFEFPLDSFSGYETYFGVKCGAKVYYASATSPPGGVIGWNFGIGRVLSFSTCAGELQVQDKDFAKLLSNAMSWAALGGGTPGGYSADCDVSGFLDLFDFLCFTNAFNSQQEYADCDGDGTYSLFDFLCFVNVFNVGC
jgi:hypothetical protein